VKLKQFSLWFSLVVIFALSANALFLLMIKRGYDSVVSVQEHRQRAMSLSNELRQETEQLTSLVREYTSTAQTRYLTYYYDILAIRQGDKPQPENYVPGTYWDMAIAGEIQPRFPLNGERHSLAERMKSLEFSKEEFDALGKVTQATEAMKQTEQIAFAATQGLYDPLTHDFVSDGKPHLDFASQQVHSQEYNQLKSNLAKSVIALVSMVDERTNTAVTEAANDLQRWIFLTLGSMALTIVMVLAALQVIRRRVLRPIETLSKAAGRLALGDYSTRTRVGSGGDAPVATSSSSVHYGSERGVEELMSLGTTFDSMAESIEQDITLRQMAQQELEAAHHMVNSSIQYAARIQRAILPPEEYFRGMVPDHFVLWAPRDVVGGDIYWCKSWGDGCLIVLGDCTGHGVPGAFMTMLSSGALDRAIRDVSPGKVDELIQHMHRILQHTLNQDSEHGQSDDGIEMGACYLNADKSRIFFAGARFDLYVLENGEVNIIKGSKSGMGYRGISYDQQFEIQEITTGKNMTFYLASDGVVDQVGAETGWGVGRKRLMQWMVEAGPLPLPEQKSEIYKKFLAYQGSAKRRDDVSVIGFRV
jgi:serine phosphatase RsbU (regulator of sigma subunit)